VALATVQNGDSSGRQRPLEQVSLRCLHQRKKDRTCTYLFFVFDVEEDENLQRHGAVRKPSWMVFSDMARSPVLGQGRLICAAKLQSPLAQFAYCDKIHIN